MKQSILPETYEENTIIGMLPGDTGYTMDWAMWADANRVLWINGRYPIIREPRHDKLRPAAMKIERTADGVIVYESTLGGAKYQPGSGGWDHSDAKLPVQLR